MHQRPGETLRKFIQRFSQVRNKIPRITDAEIISAFSAGVTDVKMREKLAMHDIDSVVKLFELADKCAKAEEGRLFAHNVPDADADAKGKGSSSKRKPPTVLAAEPEQKQHRGRDVTSGKRDGRPYCIYHDMYSHNTEDCVELKRLGEDRKKRLSSEGACFPGRGGGRGGHGGRGVHNDRHVDNNPRPARGNAIGHNEPRHGDDGAGDFQEARRVACIFGGAQAPRSNRHFQQLHREVNAASPNVEAMKPLK